MAEMDTRFSTMLDKSDEDWPSQLKLREMMVWRNDTLDLFKRDRSVLDSAMFLFFPITLGDLRRARRALGEK
jgi:hypothetical protein